MYSFSYFGFYVSGQALQMISTTEVVIIVFTCGYKYYRYSIQNVSSELITMQLDPFLNNILAFQEVSGIGVIATQLQQNRYHVSQLAQAACFQSSVFRSTALFFY